MRFTSCGSSENLRDNFNKLRAQVTELHDKLDTLVAKMDTDGGITDTDYESVAAPDADTSEDFTAE